MAFSSIAPAMASTACCWGPALLSVFGSSATSVSRLSRYRPYFLTLSATMISYSFYKVYGGSPSCCQSEKEKQAHARQLQINRAIVWLSLGVAITGATYGRVSFSNFKGTALATAAAVSTASTNTTTRVLVEGMHCKGCANTLKSAIQQVPGIDNARVDFKTGSVDIRGQHWKKEELKGAISKAGFQIKSETEESCKAL